MTIETELDVSPWSAKVQLQKGLPPLG